MRVVICAATQIELEQIQHINAATYNTNYQDFSIDFVIHGVGLLHSAVGISEVCLLQKPNLIIQIGIAGSFLNTYPIGSTVLIENEQLGDMGVVENNMWKDLFDLKLIDNSNDIYHHKKLSNPDIHNFDFMGLPTVHGITVNQITTDEARINLLRNEYKAHSESMEGAALHYTCLKHKIPFLQMRGISNMVGERNKNYWNIPLALESLQTNIIKLVQQLPTFIK